VVLVADHERCEAVREQPAAAPVPPVEARAIDAVQEVHARREPLEGRFDHQVVVRPHQAVDVADPAEADDHDVQQAEERLAILDVDEEELAPGGADGDVVDVAGEEVAGEPRHRVECRDGGPGAKVSARVLAHFRYTPSGRAHAEEAIPTAEANQTGAAPGTSGVRT
jgi:hypothetical protein